MLVCVKNTCHGCFMLKFFLKFAFIYDHSESSIFLVQLSYDFSSSFLTSHIDSNKLYIYQGQIST